MLNKMWFRTVFPVYLLLGGSIGLIPNNLVAQSLDAERETALSEVIGGLESYALANGSYVVTGTGWNGGGQGWFHYAGGVNPASIYSGLDEYLGNVPSDPLHTDVSGFSSNDFMVYTCKDKVAVFSKSDGQEPSVEDQLWWSDNNCTTVPITMRDHTFYKVSKSLSELFGGTNDSQREVALSQVIEGLESFAQVNGSYVVTGTGWNGSGQGWFHYVGGVNPASIYSALDEYLVDVPSDPLHTDVSEFSSNDFMVYTCKDKVAVFSKSDGQEPGVEDQLWWSDNNCTTVPIAIRDHTYFQVSKSVSELFSNEHDLQREAALSEVIASLENYAQANGSYVVTGTGWNGSGQGWFHYAGGANPASIYSGLDEYLINIPSDPLHIDVNGFSSNDFLVHTCEDRVAVFSLSSGQEPSEADQAWWGDNNCTRIPIDRHDHTYFQVSGPLSDNYSSADIVINEFLAKNDSDLPSGNAGEDWIELYNNENVDVNLSGWCLSDSEDEWCFPADDAATIAPFGYHVVIASGDGDESADTGYFHTNFKLSKGGEFLGLYAPGEAVPIDSYDPYPEQETDQSYGKFGGRQDSIYLKPTPNAANEEIEVLSDSLRFNVDALTLYGNDRLVTLSADDAVSIPYTLEVSPEATSWLSARSAPGEDGLLNVDDIELSVDTSGLSVGSYVGVVTAVASGFENVSLDVNLLVPPSSSNVSDWEMADVRLDGLSLPVDEEDDRVFYSIGAGYSTESSFNTLLTYNEAADFSVGFNNLPATESGASVSFANASYASEMSVQLYENGSLLESYQLVLSNLPVVSIKAESIVDEPELPGTFQFISGENSSSTAFYNMAVEYRGGTAQKFPKKPYKIEFVDSPDLDAADGLDVQFPGLRDDDDWILDAAYRDTTFVRNIVSMDLWNDIRGYAYRDENGNPVGQPALMGGLVEVIVNNEYYGVHALQETLDRKLLDLTKGSESALFKASSNFANLEFISTVREDFEQEYPDSPQDSYALLEELIELTNDSTDQQFINEIESLIDMDSAVDYWLFNVVTMAVDNVKKNYFIYRDKTGLLNFTPWDFDATFGMKWNGVIYRDEEYWPDINDGVCLPSGAENCNALFIRLNSTSPVFNNKLVARWNELKESVYTVESLSDRFQLYLDQLVPIEKNTANAFNRNRDRWPDSGGDGRDSPELGQIGWIEDWISRRLDYVDEKIN